MSNHVEGASRKGVLLILDSARKLTISWSLSKTCLLQRVQSQIQSRQKSETHQIITAKSGRISLSDGQGSKNPALVYHFSSTVLSEHRGYYLSGGLSWSSEREARSSRLAPLSTSMVMISLLPNNIAGANHPITNEVPSLWCLSHNRYHSRSS